MGMTGLMDRNVSSILPLKFQLIYISIQI